MGAVAKFEGHVFDIIPPYGPCYRCIFNEAKDDIGQEGILSPVAGVIGALQAVESIKLLLKIGKPIHERMIIYDALKGFSGKWICKNPACEYVKKWRLKRNL